MPKLACPCGATISGVIVPSPTEGILLRETDDGLPTLQEHLAEYLEALLKGEGPKWAQDHFADLQSLEDRTEVLDRILDEVWNQGLSVAECLSCGRLLVQKQPFENRYVPYAPDESGPHGILKATDPEA